jgi:hypothetical protein
MKRISLFAMLLFAAMQLVAQEKETPAPLELEFVMELNVSLGQAYGVGNTVHGSRNIVPITGGRFEGPKIKGEVLEGGADYQLSDPANGRTDVEAIYNLRTDDGVNIHIRNKGMIVMGQDEEGHPSFYFRCAPTFEAPNDSKYAWLNKAIFVCAPSMGQGAGITLRVWKVK